MTSVEPHVPLSEKPQQDTHHHSHAKLYVGIYLVLLVLTGLTVWTGNTDAINDALGSWAIVLALVIASVKGLLVMLYFMHLSEASSTNKLVIGVSIGFVALLLSMSIADSATRWRYSNSPGSTVGELPPHELPRFPPGSELGPSSRPARERLIPDPYVR